jgi:hypothetical protein
MDANGIDRGGDQELLSRRVIECAFEVSNGLGAGFLESVYEPMRFVSSSLSKDSSSSDRSR